MALTNSHDRYGAVTKTLHWLTALGILLVIPLGIVANDAPFDTSDALAFKALLFSLHKTVGITLFAVAVVRILWALSQPKPAALHPDRRFETLAADTVHWLLYGSLVLVPLTGWIHHAATTGFAPIWWPLGQSLPFVPKDVDVAETFAGLHVIFERVLVISLLLHIAGALKHQFIDRDATLRRMLPGNTQAGVPQAKHAKLVPMSLALVVWTAALGIGTALGVFAHDTGTPRPGLQAVASDWQVQDGTITITVQQMGAGVSGQFQDWTAAITYDADSGSGTVQATIAIASLSLGSVTAQAMGPDYFDATVFPTAAVAGEINRTDAGHVLSGTMTIREQTVPLEMPFDLTLTEGAAQVSGQVTVDRRLFEIGMGMADPAQLGFEVVIDLDLIATRAEN